MSDRQSAKNKAPVTSTAITMKITTTVKTQNVLVANRNVLISRAVCTFDNPKILSPYCYIKI